MRFASLSDIKIGTPSEFIQQECDIIIVSSLRPTKTGLGELSDESGKTLYQALTRAKKFVYLVGNLDSLAHAGLEF